MRQRFRRLSILVLFVASGGHAQQPVLGPVAAAGKKAKQIDAAAARMGSKTYRVPPDFFALGGGDRAGGASADPFAAGGKSEAAVTTPWKSARDILVDQGIPFPEGAMAVFDAVSCTLTVRNTSANLAMVDALILEDSFYNHAPKTILFIVHVIEAPGTVLRSLASESMKEQRPHGRTD